MKKITFLAALLISAIAVAQTETIASTSFEEPSTGSQYTDTGDASVAHDLINNVDESPVDFTQVADEIGFNARYEPYTTPSNGLTDGDFVGVTSFVGDVANYTDGVQGYQLSDSDGNMIVEFDAVDFTDYTNNTISVDYFINETGYEGDGTVNESSSDRIRIYVKDETNSTEIDILNTEGSDINDLGIEGSWITGTVTIPDDITATLVVEVRTNSGSEAIYLDNIKFEGEPAADPLQLTITEIFSGQSGTDLTADWFEIENTGTVAWTSGVSEDLYYDDESADPTTADLIQGLTEIQPGARVIVLITDNTADITTFTDVWSPVIDLTGIEIGYTDGAGLGGGGDAVTLWAGDPTTNTPLDSASYPDTDANDGQSYDVDLAAFSVVGNANGAVETIAQGGDSNDVPNIASPGNGPAVSQVVVSFDEAYTSVSEDGTEVTITITPSQVVTTEATVDVVLNPAGTAIEGTDFTFSATETVTFPVGSDASQTITIPIIDNTEDNSDIFFVVELQNVTNATVSGSDIFSVYILDDDTIVPETDASVLDVNYLTSYLVDADGTAEITAYDATTQRLFVTNSSTIEVLDFSNPEDIQPLATVDVSDFGGASVQSVATKNGMVAAAVSVDPKTDNGLIVFADVDGNNPVVVEVGALPDMITFSPDGNWLLSANEGEPNDDYSIDPEGTVSLIDVSGGLASISQASVTTLNFNDFDASQADLINDGVRIFGPGATVSQDLEPEYITVSSDSQKAYVVLQENNAYAIVDIANMEITDVISFGLKDHSLPENSLDLSDETDFIFNASWPVKGMYMPDAIAFYEVNGTSYIVTANEGDAREYDTFEEERKIGDSDYTLDPSVFNNIDILELESNLSEIAVTNASGDANDDGLFEEIHIFGGRSFSIFEAETGVMVYDSGNDFEVITAADPTYGAIFNASNSNNNYKNRSDNKGPEPEGVLVQEIEGNTYAFILLERIGGVMVYDITNPVSPQFLQYVNNRDVVEGGDEAGDLGPEGIAFVSAEESPNGTAMIIVSNEVSATVSLYSLDNIVLSTPDFTVASESTFTLYPNPASNNVFVSKPGTYNVFDMSGRLVSSILDGASINISNLTTGTYIVKNKNGVSQKLIIK
ncbi:choice-of-anchor I family protein [Marixanthomonas sp. SCSIO 43207]|uniref:choice-of-anchor I family protein n=1 Tax=Marixanthomonas sp. SCSIO 43207 TaxID=2779360 RepID=UPI001CA86CF9|nr:choice-of-anchor I family protein [Marixanthomonas sp. SCSIO 43207]UAB80230.1 choice-of-anchor I family protein [Marixanthomonas sp. SCSIO 43207]